MTAQNLITTVLTAIVAGAISAAIITHLLHTPTQTLEGQDLALQKRVEQLESELVIERQARLEQAHSFVLRDTLNELATDNPQTPNLRSANALVERTDSNETVQLSTPETGKDISPKEQRKKSLLDAGFSEEEALSISLRESAAALQSLEQQYRVRRQRLQTLEENNDNRARQINAFREEIGDDSYERYLKSRGLPTEVGIASVLNGSAAEVAGLQYGDKLINYDGQRVFNVRELNQLTLLGNEGENVLIEVVRDGEPLQITIPRGPIGITSSNNAGLRDIRNQNSSLRR